MNSNEEFKDDLLKGYIKPGMIEQAPSGFTSKVMNRIQIEEVALRTEKKRVHRNLIPIISATVFILLLVAAFMVPADKSVTSAPAFLKIAKTISSALPDIDLSSIFRISFPSVIMYIFLGIFVLTLFDRALYRMFHRAK